MWVQGLYLKSKKLNETTRLFIPFFLAGVLGLVMPQILGSGHPLIDMAAEGNLMLTSLLILFAAKFLFSLICFGSGAPGGIFFPLLVLGALLGGAYSTFAVQYMGLDASYISNMVLLAMAGYFTAIVRAPITGIILIFEMTGQVSQMLSMSLVSIVAYLVASALKSEPIYESLLSGLLKRRGEKLPESTGEKILQEFVICHNSLLQDKMIQQIEWPKNCLLVSIKRSGNEMCIRDSAVGKIPGGFNKREGKASEHAILTSRVIDRPMRPLFPKAVSYTHLNKIYDVIFILDTSVKDRIGVVASALDTAKKTICIDHHISNKGFADIDVICPTASSASELLYTLLEGEKVTKNCAEAIYTGIVNDTGVFQYSCTCLLYTSRCV